MECRFLSQVLSIIIGLLLTAMVQATGILAEEQVEAGRQDFNQGRYQEALVDWNAALTQYRQKGDRNGEARLLQYKAEAYLAIGQHYKAISNLKSALKLAETAGNDQLASQVAGSLGAAFMLSNRTDEAQALLEKVVAAEQAAGRLSSAAVVGNNLGSLLASQGEFEAAVAVYEQAIANAKAIDNNELVAKGLVNIARVMVDSKRQKEALHQLSHAAELAGKLPASHEKAYVLISIARLHSRLSGPDRLDKSAVRELEAAASVAESITDHWALSYAYGYLGELYEQAGRTKDALSYTRKASNYLRLKPAPEMSFRWQWQEGRLLRTEGEIDQAISAYQRAVSDLQTIRPVLVAGKMAKQGGFRKEAGQLYLDFADLLLTKADRTKGSREKEAVLREVRNTVEMLKGAELEDYFQDNCVAALKARTKGIDQLGKHTAAIYPIVLPDRFEILLSLPDGMKRYTVPVDAEKLNSEINRFRASLEKRTTNQYRRHAKNIYTWLIKPLENDLASQQIDTLIFIPDGAFRTIPLSALYDGKDFLISRYALATTPGLTLTDPQPLPRKNLQLLVAGLSESVQGFPPLPDVTGEVSRLDELYDGAVLQNSRFTQANIEQALGETPYSIVHVASHGEFQSDVRDTYLLTYDGKLNMNALEGYMASTKYRDQPVELLTLSACQTAVGDDKAALGLGGIAVKAGARSALATLWYINDQASSQLIKAFYAELKGSDISKAGALRQAQLSLVNDPRFSHPSYWAPFLLIGNWL